MRRRLLENRSAFPTHVMHGARSASPLVACGGGSRRVIQGVLNMGE